MPTNRLTPILEARVDELRTTGRLKGAEAVTRRRYCRRPTARGRAS